MTKITIPRFGELNSLLFEYHDELNRNSISFEAELLTEVDKRLRNADVILDMVRERVDSQFQILNSALIGKDLSEAGSQKNIQKILNNPSYPKNTIECEILAEAFYHNGWRIRQIFRSSTYPIPHLKSFNPNGLRCVRNYLIEHPEKYAGRIFGASSSISESTGPVLKIGRTPKNIDFFQDPGLYPNAIEMERELRNKLQLAVSKLTQT